MSRCDVTEDALFQGNLKILQPRKGYRFALDAVLLAGFCDAGPEDFVVDLGTGCGVVPLILAYRNQSKSIVGIEIQDSLAKLASENVKLNCMESKIRIIHGDFKEINAFLDSEQADLVVTNPPYRKVNTGRVNPNEEKALARHEFLASLDDVFRASRYLLKTKGRLGIIYPAFRLAHLCNKAVEHGFEPKKLIIIYSFPGESARLVYMEARKGGGEELYVAPPFFIYSEKGSYTSEMQKLYKN